MTRRVTAPPSTTSGTSGRKAPTARSATSRSAPDPLPRRAISAWRFGIAANRKPALAGGFLFAVSADLTELRKRLDQPQRHALETAGQKRDAGRDEEDADGLLDPAELRPQMTRRAD